MKALLRWTVATYLFCASTLAFAGNLQGGTGNSFWVGYNEAWFGQNYPNSLGSNPFFQYGSYYDRNFVDAMFAGMASGGAKIVRIWVFPALQGIQLGQCNSTNAQTVGLTKDVLANLQDVLGLAENHHLKVYLTALNGNDMKVATGSLRTYFSNLVSNTNGETTCFQNKALLPLLNLLNNGTTPDGSPNRDFIYALDLINEIEAALNSGYFPNGWTGARSWIKNMAQFVNNYSSWLPVTSAAGWGYAVPEITFGLFSGLGLNFYDLHVYADWGQYSGETALCNKVSADRVPIILGEYGQKSQTFDDNLQYWTTYNFLTTAKTHSFSAALAWKYETSLLTPPGYDWWTYLIPGPGPFGGTFRKAYSLIHLKLRN